MPIKNNLWREAVLAEAETWIGTPFHMNSASKGVGVDCSRFIAACYRAAGFDIPVGFDHFGRLWQKHTKEEKILVIIERHMTQVELPGPGTLAMLRFRTNEPFCHSALIDRWPVAIHAMHGSGVRRINIETTAKPVEVRFFEPIMIAGPEDVS